MKRGHYKNLKVWQKAMDLVRYVYAMTKSFPKEEMFGLTSQLRRAAVSIPSNIGEGNERSSNKHFQQFIETAKGSCTEVAIQMEIAHALEYITTENFDKLMLDIEEIRIMLTGLSQSLDRRL